MDDMTICSLPTERQRPLAPCQKAIRCLSGPLAVIDLRSTGQQAVKLQCRRAITDFARGSKLFAGWVGVLCGASVFYAAIAQVPNEVYRRKLLPV